MRDFTPAEAQTITEKLATEEFFQLESSYVHHPSGDRLAPASSGFAVLKADGTIFVDDLPAALELLVG